MIQPGDANDEKEDRMIEVGRCTCNCRIHYGQEGCGAGQAAE
jgi:hypothetical protein